MYGDRFSFGYLLVLIEIVVLDLKGFCDGFMLKVFDLGARYLIIAGTEEDDPIPEGLFAIMVFGSLHDVISLSYICLRLLSTPLRL